MKLTITDTHKLLRNAARVLVALHLVLQDFVAIADRFAL